MASKASPYFFWNKRLHRVIKINRPVNLVDAWSYDDNGRVALLYSDFRRKATKAVTTSDAANIMHCSRMTIWRAVDGGHIHPPQYGHILDGRPQRPRPWWGEHDLLALHEYLTNRTGMQRTPKQTYASKAEIIAKMSDANILYAKDAKTGTFVPVYDPPKF